MHISTLLNNSFEDFSITQSPMSCPMTSPTLLARTFRQLKLAMSSNGGSPAWVPLTNVLFRDKSSKTFADASGNSTDASAFLAMTSCAASLSCCAREAASSIASAASWAMVGSSPMDIISMTIHSG